MTVIATAFGDRLAVSTDDDPTTTSHCAPKGSLIIYDGHWYRKLDDGDTTNVNKET